MPRQRLAGMLVACAPLGAAAMLPTSGSPVVSAAAPPAGEVTLTPLGQYVAETPPSDVLPEGVAGSEIVAYDPATQRLFSTNGAATAIDVIDVSDPAAPVLFTQIELAEYGTDVQSVAVGDGVIAAALDNEMVDFTTDPANPARSRGAGAVAIFTVDGEFVDSYAVGSLPDMVTFTPDGTKALVANEGEAVCEYSYVDNGDGLEVERDGIDPVFTDVLVDDPEGSVSIIDLTKPSTDATAVMTAGFTAFNGQVEALRAADVRIWTGPVWDADNSEYTVAQDIEPEYLAVSRDGTTAYSTLQENNAIAVIDIATGVVTDIHGLGYKDHSVAGNGLDPSDEDGATAVGTWPVHGMYVPDSIDAAEIDGATYLFTANEGDAREWPCTFLDDYRMDDLDDELTAAFVGDLAAGGSADANDAAKLGRLKTTLEFPTAVNAEGDIDTVYSLGGRSFSIWSADGEQVFDSGDDFEQLLLDSDFFNVNGEALVIDGEPLETDNRSDDKGPEPEALTVGEIAARTYAFVGFERAGGVAVYDVSDPEAATLATYANTMADDPAAPGDVAPEAITFIPAAQSPNGEAMIAVSYEITGTVRLFQVDTPDGPLMESINPTRIVDTREKTSATVGTTYDGIGEGNGPVDPATPLVAQVAGRAGVPATATAVSINVTATGSTGQGYFTIWPCGTDRPVASSINYAENQSIANSVIVPIAADGTVCIASGVTPAHVVVDVTAWSASSEAYTALNPARLIDTRPELSPTVGQTVDGTNRGQGIVAPGTRIELPVAGRGGDGNSVPAGSAAVAVNITATGAAGNGYLTVWPCDAPSKPLASTLNYGPGAATANSVVVPLSATGTLCIESGVAAVHVVADVTGAFAVSDAFGGVVPARLVDTRPTTSATVGTTVDGVGQAGGRLPAGEQLTIQVTGRGQVPADARSVALNLVATEATGPGYLTAWPCDEARPTASSVNYAGPQSIANSIVVDLAADGTVCVFAGVTSTHVVADVTAFFR